MTTATTAPANSAGVTATNAATTPGWYDQLALQFGNAASGALGQVSQLGNNWYNQPLTAGLTQGQQDIIGQGAGTAGQWQQPFQAGLQQVQSASNWNPTTMQQHLNPYLGGVLDEIARRSNQNLTENVMPQVNRSFTGAGLFGSTGNQEFLQRAIRDNQSTIAGAQANAGLQAYNQAAQDYHNWGQLGTQGGQTQMSGALTGQGQAWADLEKQYALQEQQRLNTQQGLDANYKDWLTQLSTPYSLFGALSQATTQFPSLYKGSSTSLTTPNAVQGNALQDLLALISGIGTGARTA